MDILDKLCYDLCDVNDTVDQLYAQIFPKLNLIRHKKADTSKEASSEGVPLQNGASDSANTAAESQEELDDDLDDEIKRPLSDREIIFLLCDWATTTRRCGLHRVFYVVFLIKKRQIDLITQVKEANKQIKTVKTRLYFKIVFSKKMITKLRHLIDFEPVKTLKRRFFLITE